MHSDVSMFDKVARTDQFFTLRTTDATLADLADKDWRHFGAWWNVVFVSLTTDPDTRMHQFNNVSDFVDSAPECGFQLTMCSLIRVLLSRSQTIRESKCIFERRMDCIVQALCCAVPNREVDDAKY